MQRGVTSTRSIRREKRKRKNRKGKTEKKKKALRGIFLFWTGFQFFSGDMRLRCGKFFYGESGEKSPTMSG